VDALAFGLRSESTTGMQLVRQFYPELSAIQIQQLNHFSVCLLEWNEKLNLISRKEAEHFEERHLLSSLSILKMLAFPQGARIIDVGTGGGLPGIPLAIVFPDCEFLLVDSIGKKIHAVQSMIESLGLPNARARQARVESISESFDFVTGRAVKALPLFMDWVTPKIRKGKIGDTERGVVYLKGGSLSEEYRELGCEPTRSLDLATLYPGIEFFETKQVLFFDQHRLTRRKRKP
jgi:16S rRNA (guanine527-N7)-methyltransferase